MVRRIPASLPRLLHLLIGGWLGTAGLGVGFAASWKPVPPEELALTTPRLDPESGVEILFREAEIDDTSDESTTTRHYVRAKVFNARGVAALDRIEIIEPRDTLVINVAARVIRPDGSIVEVDKDAIYARVLLRRGSAGRRVKTFSIPALEPGCVVEYQWNEDSESALGGRQLYFQDRFPTWRVRFRIKPFPYGDRGYQLKTAGFRYEIPRLEADHRGFYNFEQVDVPALREEPWMPPDDMVQPWMMLYFLRQKQTPERYWAETARTQARDTDRRTRPTRALEEKVRQLNAGATGDLAKLQRYAVFCRDEITNRSERTIDAVAMLPPARARNASAHDTLEAGEGTAEEINRLFLALARAGGFEGRLALVTDRSKRMFRKPLPARFLLPDVLATVRMDGSWRFFDPGRRHVAAGELAWENEGVTALICDRDQHEFVSTPRQPRAHSRVSRSARLALDETGRVTGTIVVAYRGHCAVEARNEFSNATPEQLATLVYVREAARFPGLEMTEVTIANATDADAPLVLSYHVRVPLFAIAAGSRLLFPLAYFQHRLPPVFTANAREHVIYQPYEFVEDDTVELALPPGFHLEDAAAPAAFALPPTLEFRASLTPADDGTRFIYRRLVSQGGMLFPASTYRLIKQAFDDLHRQDALVVVARRADSEG